MDCQGRVMLSQSERKSMGMAVVRCKVVGQAECIILKKIDRAVVWLSDAHLWAMKALAQRSRIMERGDSDDEKVEMR